MHRVLIIVLTLLLVASCTNNSVYDVYKPVANGKWHKDSIIQFTFTPADTVSKNNLYINLRNNKEYAFNNIFLIVGIQFPNNYQVVDTLEYEMADAEGKFLGDGLTDIKQNKLEYKTNVTFPVSGDYSVSVQHAMRKSGEVNGIEELDGITDIGLQIEKVAAND